MVEAYRVGGLERSGCRRRRAGSERGRGVEEEIVLIQRVVRATTLDTTASLTERDN